MAESSAVARAFDNIAHEYDAWYEDNPIFRNERLAIASIVEAASGRSLEVGVGSGRFARFMGIRIGLDPAREPLRIASSAGVLVVQGEAGSLPFLPESLNQVYFILSLCFIKNKVRALEEASRVLIKGGGLVVGMIPRESAWGVYYEQKAKSGQSIYRYASFLTIDSMKDMITRAGFEIKKGASTLFSDPEEGKPVVEDIRPGLRRDAGFVALLASKK